MSEFCNKFDSCIISPSLLLQEFKVHINRNVGTRRLLNNKFKFKHPENISEIDNNLRSDWVLSNLKINLYGNLSKYIKLRLFSRNECKTKYIFQTRGLVSKELSKNIIHFLTNPDILYDIIISPKKDQECIVKNPTSRRIKLLLFKIEEVRINKIYGGRVNRVKIQEQIDGISSFGNWILYYH